MKDPKRAGALQLIVLFGLVALLGDIIYEGARSVQGPYLLSLGASAALVGLVAGLGEFLGYAVRILSGFFADRTRAYWVFTLAGYGLLISVPLMALAGTWQWAALFIVLERLGKAVRSPAKDVILSQAARRLGTGYGFGIHEALDQIGAVTGPLIFSGILAGAGSVLGGYQSAYAWLWLPFGLVIAAVVLGFLRFPNPEVFEVPQPEAPTQEVKRTLRKYLGFTVLTTLGFISFPVLAVWWKSQGLLQDWQIPLVYALAMGVDALAALGLGRLYDRLGLKVLWIFPLLSLGLPVLGLLGSGVWIWVFGALWGVVMGAHETLMKAAISDLVPLPKRGSAFGVFHTAYGLGFMGAAALAGFLLEIHWAWVLGFCAATQGAAVLALAGFLRQAKTLQKTGA